jgi:AraC-like DNA-binding protein
MIEAGTGARLEEQAGQDIIVFLLGGEISCSFGMYNNCGMRRGQALYLPVGYDLSYRAESEARLLFIRPGDKLGNLMRGTPEERVTPDTDSPCLLEMHGALKAYADMLAYCIGQGLCCGYYNELKIDELIYLFGEFYTRGELGLFFREALNRDRSFSRYVMNNCHRYNSLSELAEALNMSLSGLEKRFRKVFNTSGYKWMNEHRAKRIYHALVSGDKPLNDLRAEFGFASKSSFNRYCRQQLGESPGKIRHKSHREQNR